MGSIAEPAWLWHARLGHVNFQTIKMMFEKEMAHGVPRIDLPTQLCEGAAKQTRSSFPAQATYRADLAVGTCGLVRCPITPHTPAGNRYFLLLVDDYSRLMWVYMLKSKDEAFRVFKKYKALVEKETEHKLKENRPGR